MADGQLDSASPHGWIIIKVRMIVVSFSGKYLKELDWYFSVISQVEANKVTLFVNNNGQFFE